MRRTIDFAVRFARFCQQHKLDPLWLGELLELSLRCKWRMELGTSHQKSGSSLKTPTELVREKAAEYDFGVYWYGLMPTLQKDGKEYQLPCP